MPRVSSLGQLLQASGQLSSTLQRNRQLALQERRNEQQYQLQVARFNADAAEAQRAREERTAFQTMNAIEMGRADEAARAGLGAEGVQNILKSMETRNVGGVNIPMPDLGTVREEVGRFTRRQMADERRQEVIKRMSPEHARRFLIEDAERQRQEALAEGGKRMAGKIQDMIVEHAFDDYDGSSYTPNEARNQRVEMIMEGLDSGAVSPGQATQLVQIMASEAAKANQRRMQRVGMQRQVQERISKETNRDKLDRLTNLAALLPSMEPDDVVDKLFEIENGRKTSRAANDPMAFFEKVSKAMDPYVLRTGTPEEIAAHEGAIIDRLTGGRAGSREEAWGMFNQTALDEARAQSEAPQLVGSPSAPAGPAPEPPPDPIQEDSPDNRSKGRGFLPYGDLAPEEQKAIDSAAAEYIVKKKPRSKKDWERFLKTHTLSGVSEAQLVQWFNAADALRKDLANPFTGESHGTL